MAVSTLESVTLQSLEAYLPQSSQRLQALRKEGWGRFTSMPWPAKTHEEWRRTDPAAFQLEGIELQPPSPALTVGWEPVAPEMIKAGVILTDLATALRQFPELVDQYLFQTGDSEQLQKFVALHQALWNQGLFCYVPEGVAVEKPIRMWAEVTRGGSAIFPHLLLVVEKGASAVVLDERRSAGAMEGRAISDEMTEIVVKEEGHFQYIRFQRWGSTVRELLSQRTVLERDAQFLHVNVGIGGGVTKGNIETTLKGVGSRADLLGVLCGRGNQHFDFNTLQDHFAPHTTSDLLYKSALKDHAKAVYTGLIRIRKQAQKSDAYQANRNLLLSQGAKADSIPKLEIEADDVRCTHGVAVGPVDEDQLFYLSSRGIPQEEAEQLIVEGFFEQLFQRIPVPEIREELTNEITHGILKEGK